MKILWVANFETQSGYSIQSRLTVRELLKLGHEVTVLSLGSSGQPRMIDGVQVIPTALDMFGHDLVLPLVEKLRADVVFTLVDAWGLNGSVYGQTNWFPFTPIDHTPTPPAVLAALRQAKTPIALSRFGANQLRGEGINAYYVPHAVDPAIWQPIPMQQARRTLNVPAEAFWVSFVGVNDSTPSRKGIPEMLAAWQMFSRDHGDAILYLHTGETGNLAINSIGGVRIPEIMKTFGINPKSVHMVDQFAYRTGLPTSYLANVYAASDVLILASRGEGFGLPLIEAQRCGCPVITTDFAAGKELCASGWLLDFAPAWSFQNALQAQVDVGSIYERLCEAYEHRGDQRYRMQAIEFAREYDIETVVGRYLAPVINEIAERVVLGARIA